MGVSYESSFNNVSLNKKETKDYGSLDEVISVENNKGIIITTIDGKLLFANSNFIKLTGVSLSQYFNSDESLIHFFQDTGSNNRLFLSLLKKEISNYVLEKKIFLNNGMEKWVRIEVFLISKLDSTANLLIGVVKDISEKVFTVVNGIPSETPLDKKEETDKDESLFELGKTVSFITHEFKSALSAIKLNMDMFLSSRKLEEDDKVSLSLVNKEINRLSRMLKEILQFSKQSEPTFVKIDLLRTIRHIQELYQPMLSGKKINFTVNIKNVYLKGDMFNLQSVFMHLIENAIEAVSVGGTIELSATVDYDCKMALILISDNGKGIIHKEKIFEPFYSNKNSGTGLGLSIAKKIVKQHDGFITLVASKPSETIFQLILPMWVD